MSSGTVRFVMGFLLVSSGSIARAAPTSFVSCDGPIDSRGAGTQASPGVWTINGSGHDVLFARQVAQTFTVPANASELPWRPGTVSVTLTKTVDVPADPAADNNLYVELISLRTASLPTSTGESCDTGIFPNVIARAAFDTSTLSYGADTPVRIPFQYDVRSPDYEPLQGGIKYALLFHLSDTLTTRIGLSSNDQADDFYTGGYAYTRQMDKTNGCLANAPWLADSRRDLNFCLTVNDGIALDGGGGDAGSKGDAGFQRIDDDVDAGQNVSLPAGGCDCGTTDGTLLSPLFLLVLRAGRRRRMPNHR